jgi:hypothetical protein
MDVRLVAKKPCCRLEAITKRKATSGVV